MAGGESTGAILAAFLANVGIAVAKFAGFVITGSSSLLAEAIHSVADSSNQGLLVLGGRQAKAAPDTLHQFGHGRVRYFWAFVVAVVLFSLGGLFSVYEGYHKIRDPHEIDSPGVAIAILVVAMALEGFALRTAVRHATPHRGKRSWTRYIREARTPELPVLLLEDSGALVGLSCALSGVLLARHHRRARVRRHRHARHRRRPAVHRGRAGDRDALAADRRVRLAANCNAGSRPSSRTPRASTRSSTCSRSTSAPRRS